MKRLSLITIILIFTFSCKKDEETTSTETSTDSNINKPAYVGTTPLSGKPTVSSITSTSATINSQIMNDGQLVVTDRGIIYSNTHIPSNADITLKNGSGIGTFKNNLTGLDSGKTYYVKTYCTNSAGTNYSSEVSFTTN